MLRMLLVVAAVLGSAAPALAQNFIRPEFRMRMPVDGRADTQSGMQSFGTQRPDAYSRPAQGDAKIVYDRMGREEHRPALPIRTEVALKMQNGDNRETNSAATIKPAAARDANKESQSAFKIPALTPDQREALCRQTGVCLAQKFGSDSSNDTR